MRGLAALLACLLAVGCAGGIGGLSVPPIDVVDLRTSPRPLPAALSLPSGTGPFPVVILLHGCGGGISRTEAWASRLNGWATPTSLIDSFTPRNVATVCAALQPRHAARPRRAVADQCRFVPLRTRPDIDPNRIGVLGLSHGGATAAWVTQARYEKAYPGLLRASVDYYGPCRSPETHGTAAGPGGRVRTTGATPVVCRGFGAKLRPGQPFEIHTYPGVFHAFDDPQTATRKNEGHWMGYNHDAAVDSYERVRLFLAKWLDPGR